MANLLNTCFGSSGIIDDDEEKQMMMMSKRRLIVSFSVSELHRTAKLLSINILCVKRYFFGLLANYSSWNS